ncbi:MAG: Holliday junction branch migration protein RuvA [Chloroflexota bacterium]
MISYLSGTLKRKLPDRVVVDVGGVGYDVFLPQFVMRTIDAQAEGDKIEFDIYYHVTDRQLKPTLIGFKSSYEKRFFEKFISVEDIGPLKAARALSLSVSTIAQAIESEDISLLRQLPGIGDRTAKKMVATLRGKVAEEALLQDDGFSTPQMPGSSTPTSQVAEDGIDILIDLGHRRAEATSKVQSALKRRPEVATVDELILEVYRGEQGAQT